MTILAFLNQKGGAGKTTACTNIAVELVKRGYSVVIIDTDNQRSATDWRCLRKSDDVPVIECTRVSKLEADARREAGNYDVVLIDGAAKVEDITAVSMKVSDAVVIPVQPAPKDVWGTKDLVDMIHTRQTITDGKPVAAFVVSQATKGTKLSKSIDDKLLEMQLPVFSQHIHDLEIYKQVDETGMAVSEATPNGPADREIAALVDEMIENGFLQKK